MIQAGGSVVQRVAQRGKIGETRILSRWTEEREGESAWSNLLALGEGNRKMVRKIALLSSAELQYSPIERMSVLIGVYASKIGGQYRDSECRI